MGIKEGDIFESMLDGTEYIVTKIANRMVVLGSMEQDRQILTAVETLKIESLYHRKGTRSGADERARADICM